ncbi:hypothetical protein KHF85_03160 [Xanthomonas translucens pv. graminis]|uniref:hypothetical protein n=1 Tax=Xanthomonas graminis TaxID=3390026 RepID=UPI0025405ADC|nr:hypothetical protein [Xanthomonas translucens]WIH05515.1 hypothetical protein KHF85_03160 [Xanthomonas translucens pv. graminis]
MRADRSRRLAALEAKPAPAPTCPAALAFWTYFDELLVSHGPRVSPAPMAKIHEAFNEGSSHDAAVAAVDFMEAIERIDPEASARLNHLLDSA